MRDRTGQVWEDPQGRLHLIVKPSEPSTYAARKAFFHPTLRLLSGERSSLTDLDGRCLEDREGWRRLA